MNILLFFSIMTGFFAFILFWILYLNFLKNNTADKKLLKTWFLSVIVFIILFALWGIGRNFDKNSDIRRSTAYENETKTYTGTFGIR